MMKTPLICGMGIAALLSIGCGADTRPGFEPAGVPQAGSSAAHAGAPVDVSATWAWTTTRDALGDRFRAHGGRLPSGSRRESVPRLHGLRMVLGCRRAFRHR
jgi:hypothetical protein